MTNQYKASYGSSPPCSPGSHSVKRVRESERTTESASEREGEQARATETESKRRRERERAHEGEREKGRKRKRKRISESKQISSDRITAHKIDLVCDAGQRTPFCPPTIENSLQIVATPRSDLHELFFSFNFHR